MQTTTAWRWNSGDRYHHLGRGEDLEHRSLCGADILTAGFYRECPANQVCPDCLKRADRDGMPIPLVTASQVAGSGVLFGDG